MFSAGQMRDRVKLFKLNTGAEVSGARQGLDSAAEAFLLRGGSQRVDQEPLIPLALSDGLIFSHSVPLPPMLPNLVLFQGSLLGDSAEMCEEPSPDQLVSLLPANESVSDTTGVAEHALTEQEDPVRDTIRKGALMLFSPVLAGFSLDVGDSGSVSPEAFRYLMMLGGMCFVGLFIAVAFWRQRIRERHIDPRQEAIMREAFITMFSAGQRNPEPDQAPSPVSASREASAVASDLVEGLQAAFEAPASAAPAPASVAAPQSAASPESAPAPASEKPSYQGRRRFMTLEYDEPAAPASAPASSH